MFCTLQILLSFFFANLTIWHSFDGNLQRERDSYLNISHFPTPHMSVKFGKTRGVLTFVRTRFGLLEVGGRSSGISCPPIPTYPVFHEFEREKNYFGRFSHAIALFSLPSLHDLAKIKGFFVRCSRTHSTLPKLASRDEKKKFCFFLKNKSSFCARKNMGKAGPFFSAA